MIRFLLGYSLVGIGLISWNVGQSHLHGWLVLDYGLRIAMPLLVAPIAAVAPIVMSMQYASPRRMFRHRMGLRVGLIVTGLSAGILGTALTAIWLAYGARYWSMSETLEAAAAGGLATIIVISPARRIQAGKCIECEFDLRQSIGFGRCPECGERI